MDTGHGKQLGRWLEINLRGLRMSEEWRRKRFLNFKETMEILEYNSKNTIYRLLEEGKLKAFNPNGEGKDNGTRIITISVIELLDKGIIPAEKWLE